MSDPIRAVEEALDRAGRACLRLIGTRELSAQQSRQLAKWLFGCMNQRYTIRRRVASRGVGELDKVLRFIGTAWAELQEIEASTSDFD